jgi:hypothetical protein
MRFDPQGPAQSDSSMMPRASLVCLLSLLLATGLARGECLYEQSPWRCETEIGGARYRIWIDDHAIESTDSTRIYDWRFLEGYFRTTCMRCAPHAWGESEFMRMLLALDTKDQGYVPLQNRTFIPLNFAIQSGGLPDVRPSYGGSPTDSFVVTLHDGRVLAVAVGKVEVPDPTDKRTESLRQTCAQLARQLGQVTMFRGDELLALSTSPNEAVQLRYSDRPCANIRIIVIPNGGHDFAPADLTSAYLVFQRRRIPLVQNITQMKPRERSGR